MREWVSEWTRARIVFSFACLVCLFAQCSVRLCTLASLFLSFHLWISVSESLSLTSSLDSANSISSFAWLPRRRRSNPPLCFLGWLASCLLPDVHEPRYSFRPIALREQIPSDCGQSMGIRGLRQDHRLRTWGGVRSLVHSAHDSAAPYPIDMIPIPIKTEAITSSLW